MVIRDISANMYTQPVTVASIGAAIRDFGDRCQGKAQGQQPGDMIAMHPEDFELYVIGEFGDGDGKITEYTEARKQIAAGTNYK